MGLDMWLIRQLKKPKTKKEKILAGLKSIEDNGEEVGNWRKANAIHGWFVDNYDAFSDD